MIVHVEFEKDGEKVVKNIYCDDSIDCAHLKELACCEAASSPSYTRISFNGKNLNGSELVSEFGVVDGVTIQLVTAGLK